MTQSIDVYGLGNALVDTEIQVDDDFLARHEIAKGHMTLVELDRQQQLIAALGSHEAKHASGGSAANSLLAIQGMGGTAYYSCKVANDDVGRFFVEDMRAAGVRTNAGEMAADGTSGQCLVLLTPDAERTMNTFLGVSHSLSLENLDEDALRTARFLYMEGYLCTSDSAREALIRARAVAREAGVRIAATLSDPSMVEMFAPQLREMLGERVDHLFCNEEEALTWTGTTRAEDAAEALKQSAETFSMTRGGRGCLVWDGERMHDVPAPVIEPLDTLGAGDLFAGAYLYALCRGHAHARAAEFACRAASLLVTRLGPRLPLEEYRALASELG